MLFVNSGEDVLSDKVETDLIAFKDSVNNSAGSLTDLSQVMDDKVAGVVENSSLNNDIGVGESKNDNLDGFVDNSTYDADRVEAENIDIVPQVTVKAGSNDIVNEVVSEVVSDGTVSEVADIEENIDVDDVGTVSEVGFPQVKGEVGSNDIVNEVVAEVVSDGSVSEAASLEEKMDVDAEETESEEGVSTHSDSMDADEVV